jgi:hypothetical protein
LHYRRWSRPAWYINATRCFNIIFCFCTENRGRTFLSTRLHGVTLQKTVNLQIHHCEYVKSCILLHGNYFSYVFIETGPSWKRERQTDRQTDRQREKPICSRETWEYNRRTRLPNRQVHSSKLKSGTSHNIYCTFSQFPRHKITFITYSNHCNAILSITHVTVQKYKNFWEQLNTYIPWYDTNRAEDNASNNSSIVAHVFVAAVTFIPSRCLATIGVSKVKLSLCLTN